MLDGQQGWFVGKPRGLGLEWGAQSARQPLGFTAVASAARNAALEVGIGPVANTVSKKTRAQADGRAPKH